MVAVIVSGSSNRFSRAVAAAAARPERAFAGFLVVHAAVWTLLPLLICKNLQLDLVESLTMGREWQIGYYKHPPLPWWLADIAYRLSGGKERVLYLLAQVAMVATFWAVWRMAREVVTARAALVGVTLLEGIHFYSFSSIKFAHDQCQLLFWALTVWRLYRGLTLGRALDWALAGAALALAFWSKYAAAMLAATLFLFLIVDPRARRCWRTAGPWFALASFAAVLAPNVLWLVANDFRPFSYVDHRSLRADQAFDHLAYPALFAGAQLIFLMPAIALIALLIGRPGASTDPPRPAVDGFARRYLTVATFGPFLLTVGAAAITGRSLVPMWGYPFWLFFGLTAIVWLRPSLGPASLRRFAAGLAVVFIASAALYAVSERYEALWDHRMKATHFPGRSLAEEVTRRWRGVSDRPLKFVVGEMFLASNVSVYAPDHPRVFLDADLRKSPWIDPRALRRDGAVIVWPIAEWGEANPATLLRAFPQAEQQSAMEFQWQNPATVPPIRIGVAIVPPQP